MFLYHGTNKKRLDSIKKEGLIVNAPKASMGHDFIYLTDKPEIAAEFSGYGADQMGMHHEGYMAPRKGKLINGIVLKVNVNKKYLAPDKIWEPKIKELKNPKKVLKKISDEIREDIGQGNPVLDFHLDTEVFKLAKEHDLVDDYDEGMMPEDFVDDAIETVVKTFAKKEFDNLMKESAIYLAGNLYQYSKPIPTKDIISIEPAKKYLKKRQTNYFGNDISLEPKYSMNMLRSGLADLSIQVSKSNDGQLRIRKKDALAMWKRNVEQKYIIEALAKSDIDYVIEKYTSKGVMDGDRIYLIPANTKALKNPTTKLYPDYDGHVGFMAFKVSEIKNTKTYASRINTFKAVKYVHVVKAITNIKTIDLKKKKTPPSDLHLLNRDKKNILLQGVSRSNPDMSVFTSNLGFQLVETVEHTAPVVQLTQEEKDLLESYAPDFSQPTPYRKQMSVSEVKQSMKDMSADDVAWQLMHNKRALELHDDIRMGNFVSNNCYRSSCLFWSFYTRNIRSK